MNQVIFQKIENILIVEDEVAIGIQLSSQLKKFGYNVEELVLTGESAIEKSKELSPSLVLIKIPLKGKMDGIETAYEIKKLGIPFVYLTSHEDNDTFQRAKETLPYGYLIKPYKNNDLKNIIEIALFKHKSEQELKQRESLLNSIFFSLKDLILATDSKGIITLVNKPTELFLHKSSKDLIGKALDDVLGFKINSKIIAVKSFLEKSGPFSEIKNFTVFNSEQKSLPVSLTISHLLKSTDQDVIKGIVFVMNDLSQQKLLETKTNQHRDLLLQMLTDREKQTLQYLVDGEGTKDIAIILDISPRTVEYHRQNIMRKFDVHDLTGVVHFALSNQLVKFS